MVRNAGGKWQQILGQMKQVSQLSGEGGGVINKASTSKPLSA